MSDRTFSFTSYFVLSYWCGMVEYENQEMVDKILKMQPSKYDMNMWEVEVKPMRIKI